MSGWFLIGKRKTMHGLSKSIFNKQDINPLASGDVLASKYNLP